MKTSDSAFYSEPALREVFTACLARAGQAGEVGELETKGLRAILLGLPSPVQACQLFLARNGSRLVLWAGALLCRADGPDLFLFRLPGSLERFASLDALRQGLEQLLDSPAERHRLLRFTPLDVRQRLSAAGSLVVQVQPVASSALAGVSRQVGDFVQRCQETTLASLVSAPSLHAVVEARELAALARKTVGQAPAPDDLQLMEQIPQRMQAALQQWWHTPLGPGPSPYACCVALQGDRYYQQCLQALYDRQVTPVQFDLLESVVSAAGGGGQMHVLRLSVFDPNNGAVNLAGLLGVFFVQQDGPVFLFGGPHGLQQYSSRSRLKARLLSPLRAPPTFEHLARHVALAQQGFLLDRVVLDLSVEHLSSDPFAASIDSIQSKQVDDFAYLLRMLPARGVALAAADHGLDVRLLVDGRLLALDSGGRWSSRYEPQARPPAAPAAVNGWPIDRLAARLASVAAQRDELLRAWPAPLSYARLRLLEALARAGHEALDIERILLRHPGAREPVTLVAGLLQHATGYLPLPRDPQQIEAGLYGHGSGDWKPQRSLPGTKLLNLLEQAASDFFPGFVAHLSEFFHASLALSRPDTRIDRLGTLRLALLRAQLHLRQQDHPLEATDMAVLTTVLGQPVSARRPAWQHFVPDVFGVALLIPGVEGAVDMVNCLLFTQRGGLESVNAGRAIFWSPGSGFEGFASLDACRAWLQARLMDKALRWELLAHVSLAAQPQTSAWLDSMPGEQNRWLFFERYEHDFTREAQQRVIAKVLADAGEACRQARAIPLSAQAFENLVQSALVHGHAGVTPEPVLEAVHLQRFEASLAPWLKSAPAADQLAYAGLLQRYQHAGQAAQNYLHDIPPIIDYARSMLTLRLELDFPSLVPGPDAIEVVIDTYLASTAPVGNTPSYLPAATTRTVQTLTQFSLNGFYRLNDGALSLRASNATPLPEALNATYVRRVTRQLDIGAHYRALLQDKLTPGNTGVAKRQQQFAELLSVQVMEQVLREKLMEPGKELACGYVKHVISMPDGAARLPLNGQAIIVRPFELLAEPDAAPDRARGLYLIGPAHSGGGPQVLWVSYSEHYTFRAYSDEPALLEDLRVSTPFQALVLQRLEPEARKTYNYGGFTEPHVPRYVDASPGGYVPRPAPPTLGLSPIAGNLFEQLYTDNYHLLLDMAAAQSRTTAEADWESFKYLFSLIASTALMFLPARLSIPMVVWQSLGSLQQGVESALKGDWGEAVAGFASSLAQIGTGYRTPRIEPAALHQPEVRSRVRLTPEQEAGLQPFQTHDVALQDLELAPSTRLYLHPGTGRQYVLLAGHVFRVQAWRERWRIYLGEQREGPLVRLNEDGQWALDLKEPLLGGGPVLSVTARVADHLTHEIQAVGMVNIERRFPDKALAIREAHAQAVTYLQRCQSALHGLLGPGPENARNRALVAGFFDVEEVSQPLLERLGETVEPLLTRLLHPDLSPQTSGKYVVCRARYRDNAVAWIHRWDTGRRVYLSDRFFSTIFDTPYALSQSFVKTVQPPFRTNVHYRATFLLHELTHQVLSTEDINYLNPGFPYEDLLDDSTPLGSHIKSFNRIVQRCHSPQIPTEHLFQEFDPEAQTWADMPASPGKAKVKAIAGVKTLDQARRIFRNDPRKRIDMMLANADTVVLLLTRLGRVEPALPQERVSE